MSVWHEVQIEFARDAVDDLIQQQGEDAALIQALVQVKNLIGEAEDIATDLPEDALTEAITRLDRSRELLVEAENKVPEGEDKLYRILLNELKHAQKAVRKTKEDFLALS